MTDAIVVPDPTVGPVVFVTQPGVIVVAEVAPNVPPVTAIAEPSVLRVEVVVALGGGGGSDLHAVRSATTATHTYTGVAPTGSPEADPVWTIERITFSPLGTTHATGAWSDRLTLIYV